MTTFVLPKGATGLSDTTVPPNGPRYIVYRKNGVVYVVILFDNGDAIEIAHMPGGAETSKFVHRETAGGGRIDHRTDPTDGKRTETEYDANGDVIRRKETESEPGANSTVETKETETTYFPGTHSRQRVVVTETTEWLIPGWLRVPARTKTVTTTYARQPNKRARQVVEEFWLKEIDDSGVPVPGRRRRSRDAGKPWVYETWDFDKKKWVPSPPFKPLPG